MCPPGTQRNLTAGGCSVCPPDTFKDVAGSNPCSRCPAGTYTNPIGNSPADHDQQSDCFQITTDKTCEPGTQLDLEKGRCTVCPANTIKAGTNTDRCQPCPDGSRTFGDTASDHNEPSDCFAGGLIASTGNTGASAEALLDFEEELEWARNNTGPKKNPPRPPKKTKKPKKACLYACDGVPDDDTAFSAKVAHIAGSPAVYFMNDPSLVRSGVNLVSAVRDQRSCGTCVSHALASAAESAAAAAMRVDARGFAISHTFSYFCASYYTDLAGGKSCGTGWDLKEALLAMKAAPAAFVMNSSCLQGGDPAVTQLPARLKAFCTSDVPTACKAPGFTCKYTAVSDGLFQIQQHIRLYGSVVTRVLVTESFISFLKSNPTGVFLGSAGVNSTADQSDEKSFAHAVQLIGYDNEGMFWLAKQSWGSGWGDKGFFKIAYGAAGVGHPEDTFALVDCFTTSKDPATVTAWSDRWPVTADELPGCVLYNATARDTISGIADHFQVEILPFVNDNTERQVIPTLMLGEPPRPEPQLQPNTSWAGTVFRVCGIPSDIYNRVAADPCTTDAKHCNSRQTHCAAGRCVCPERYAGRFCETDNGIQRNFSLPNGQGYVLHLEPRLNWTAAQQRCERDGMRLARLYSRQHAVEVHKQVMRMTDGEFWIGLNDRRQEGSFAWDGGSRDASETPIDSEMWGGPKIGGQPDNGNGSEDCVLVWPSQGLFNYQATDAWHVIKCGKLHMLLCGPAEESADPCVRFPCSSAGTRPAVGCVAANGNNSNSVSGRVCLCDAGLSYVSDELGCVEPPVFDVYEFQLNGVAHALFLSPQASWAHANIYCRDRGMNLVKITGEDYAQQLHASIKSSRFAERGFEKKYWIGLNDRAAEGKYVWSSDGTSLAQAGGYQRWTLNEPSVKDFYGGDEDCVWVWGFGDWDGYWNDGTCGTKTFFVCSTT